MPPLVYVLQKSIEEGKLAQTREPSKQAPSLESCAGVEVSEDARPAVSEASHSTCSSHEPCGVEFGTVLVHSCLESCWRKEGLRRNGLDGFVEEHIIVQSDPEDGTLRKITHQ